MNNAILGNELLDITLGSLSSFIHITDKKSGKSCILEPPQFEIDGETYGGKHLQFECAAGKRNLLNGGVEAVCIYSINGFEDLKLRLFLRYFPGSPIVRFKYVLYTSSEGCTTSRSIYMTKKNGSDNIMYTGFNTSEKLREVTEIQFSQFNPVVHSFVPCFQQRPFDELEEGTQFPGPILMSEFEGFSTLLAFEHGAEYPDTYLAFKANKNVDMLSVSIDAVKGNYYNGQEISDRSTFESPWFHFALCPRDREEMLKHYRNFFLRYIAENNESRKPYIYYNTWNFQERNRYFKGMKYLDTMHQEQMLKEIDIAHEMGVDVFVIDTGWYDKTGDWVVNKKRFPDGLKSIKEKLDSYGMKLGLWFNPIVAAKTSEIFLSHPEYVISKDGKENYWGSIWETEESYGMCLSSGYSDYFIEKLAKLHEELGVSYFKWDAIGQYGCNSPLHNHGTMNNTPDERMECYSFKMGMEMIRIVEELSRRCPGVIVDFDVTEGGRFVGLGFLSVGKYFLMNNGPYFKDFDLPDSVKIQPDTINVFFYPGPARDRICRQGILYDSFVPSILFLTHFLPDKPKLSQMNTLCSLLLGGNGIWGDLLSLHKDDIELFKDTLDKYKMVAGSITESYPRFSGFIGSSPEIYEKINYEKCEGLICFFTRSPANYEYITGKIDSDSISYIDGADSVSFTEDGRIKITVKLERDEARPVFICSKA